MSLDFEFTIMFASVKFFPPFCSLRFQSIWSKLYFLQRHLQGTQQGLGDGQQLKALTTLVKDQS